MVKQNTMFSSIIEVPIPCPHISPVVTRYLILLYPHLIPSLPSPIPLLNIHRTQVAADADLAEKVYLYLQTMGIHAFLDKKCLKDGQPWKEGFLAGLSSSRKFLCLISSSALANVRNFALDHAYDIVLLEYETGQLIRNLLKEVDADLAKSYIIPILVGHFSQGVLTKFTEFNPNLYPDSVGPDATTMLSVSATTSTVTSSVDLTTCEGVISALKMQPLEPAQAEAALRAMGNLCRLDDSNSVTLDELGACELIPAVLTGFATTNAFVAAQGCYAMHSIAKVFGNDSSIVNLISEDDAMKMSESMSAKRAVKLVNAGAIDVMVAAFRTFPSSAAVAEHVCWLVFQLSSKSTNENGIDSKLVNAGLEDMVVRTLRAFPSNADVAKCACGALACVLPEDSKVKFVDEGKVELVLTAMRKCPSSEGVAQFGLMLFALLLDGINDGAVERFLTTGVIEIVITTLRAFATHPDILMSFAGFVGIALDKDGAEAILKVQFLELGAKPLFEAASKNDSLAEDIREGFSSLVDMLSQDKEGDS